MSLVEYYIINYSIYIIYYFILGNNYALKMRFVDHIFDNQAIDELNVRIILPEGSKLVFDN